MTATEIVVIIACMIVGYWLVSYFMRDPEELEFPSEAGSGSDRQSQAPSASFDFVASWDQVLGVSVNASREEIVAAYKQKISQYHPDKVVNMGEEIRELAERRSKQINAAYDAALRERGY